ncbi:MAG: insulinase family protein [Acidobacteria bacterium]|nr:insulinase family protein [Acidobacteriota bacterium]
MMPARSVTIPARSVRLDNGLLLIARENRAARSIAARVVVEAGCAFDPPGKEGTAALLAGLLDRGAGNLSAEAIAEGFEFLGATYVARAQRDTLDIEIRLLSEHLPQILDRLRLLLVEPTFPDEEVRREKESTLTAIAEREQDTASVAEEALAAALFPAGHPYHSRRLGTRESIRGIGRDDLRSFHRARLRPAGTILVLAGDLEADRTLDRAAAVFGAWRDGGTAEPRVAVPDVRPPEAPVTIVRPIEGKTQADIALGFVGLPRRSPDLPAAMVLNNVLGEFGLGGRLGKAVRERAGLAYYAYSRFAPGLGAGPFLVRAGVASGRVTRAVGLIRRTIQALRCGVTPAEVKDSKRALSASVPRYMETNPEAAAFLADAAFYGLGIDYPDRLPAQIEAVERREVEAAAGKYLTLGRHVLVVAGPQIKEEEIR